MRNEPAGSPKAHEREVEVELCTTLLIASTESERVLTQDEVDQLLGVPAAGAAPAPPA